MLIPYTQHMSLAVSQDHKMIYDVVEKVNFKRVTQSFNRKAGFLNYVLIVWKIVVAQDSAPARSLHFCPS